MTEFLKGYAAGANDMEAGRLVTPKVCPTPKACWGEGVCLSVEGGGPLCALPRASALTTEEAKVLVESTEYKVQYGQGYSDLETPAWLDTLERAKAKLSLIANGEN